MRLRRGREAILVEHELREQEDRAVGVLESRQLPPASVCLQIADECQVPPEHLCLLVAPVSSLAGTVQVVARSIETAIHKLHAIDFDIRQIRSAWGAAPLPPVAINDLQGIGRTNDAILYGAEVTLWVHADDDELRQLGPLAPSCSSRDYGRPFAEIFSAFDHDFYKIDPLLFSPAVMSFVNLRSGRCFRFGQARPDLLGKSFGCESAS
jgi:methenyltetrahydromethanopterin cyclohydrolase